MHTHRIYRSLKNGFITTVLFFSLVVLNPVSAEITIGIIGDQLGVKGPVNSEQFNKNLKAAYQAMARGVAALNKAGEMDTVLHVGDLIESTQSESQVRTDFQNAAEILDTLNSQSRPKWYLTPGDHDVNPLEWIPNSLDRSKERLFKSVYKAVNPRVEKHLYYSFDIKGYHFVALYSQEHLRTDPRWGNVYFAKISDDQLEWLEKDLADADTGKGVIVFTHQPLWYNWGSWRRVHELLARYNTKVVVAGHYHYDQSDFDLDKIQYRVVGATGGSIKTATARAGGWWHVSRLTIRDNGSVSWQLIPVNPPDRTDPIYKNRFTNRYDMDRIQALDLNLGNATRQLAKQKVAVKDGRLTGPDGREPAELTLAQFGNPTDEDVFMTIRVKTPAHYAIKSGRFTPGLCDGSPAMQTCRIRPGANIIISNNSMVSAKCDQYTPDFSCCRMDAPFWKGTLAYVGNGFPKAGDTVVLTLRMVYDSKTGSGEMAIWRDIPIEVVAVP